jgi:hypothetical protein
MLPGSIWQTFMTGALRGTPVEQFSPFVALGTPPGTATDESTDGTDENSDGNSDDEDKDKDKKKSDSDSSDSDHGSDGSSGSDSSRSSDSESDSGSGSGSGGSGSDDSSDEGAAFQEPRFTVPGLRNSQPVRQTSGQQPLAAGTPTAG